MLHAFSLSVQKQCPSRARFSVNDLLDAITRETVNNACKYLPGIEAMDKHILHNQLHKYRYEKLYNSSFGDLVPLVIANVHNVNLLIVESCGNGLICNEVKSECNNNDTVNVILYRHMEHYDAVVPRTHGVQLNMRQHALDNEGLGKTKQLGAYCADKTVNCKRNLLKLCYWNIHGVNDAKLSNDFLGKFLTQYDLILIAETWAGKGDTYQLPGYTYHNFPRQYTHPSAWRSSGGLGIFIRHDIEEGVQIGNNVHDVIAWLKLRKEFFDIPRDIWVSLIYITPETSLHKDTDEFSLLEREFASVPKDCDILACGDFNAHTSDLLDLTPDVDIGSDGDLSNLVHKMTSDYDMIQELYNSNALNRVSEDVNRRVNNQGKRLIDLCKSVGVIMVNGRVGADKGVGKYTRIDSCGHKSVVDYILCSPKLFPCVKEYEVNAKVPESDHLPITMAIETGKINSKYHNTEKSCNWNRHEKYVWSHADLETIKVALKDTMSMSYYDKFRSEIIEQNSTNEVAGALSALVAQACNRTCPTRSTGATGNRRHAPWFDKECRAKRIEAVKAGERATSHQDYKILSEKCKEYRSCKQRKKREHRENNVRRLEAECSKSQSKFWKTLNNLNGNAGDNQNMPQKDEFLQYFKNMSAPIESEYFQSGYLDSAKAFLQKYDTGDHSNIESNSLELEVLNDNFTCEEISTVIDALNNNKSPGNDNIPAEFIKSCKTELLQNITDALNYIIEMRDFPDMWAEGLRSAIYKGGQQKLVDNYRGITVLTIFAKIFEAAVYNRLKFLNEAFGKVDKYNGGFLEGCRTTDNMFVLKGLIDRQLLMGKSLYVCFIDFSKAFDMVNRHILFYKLMKSGWHGRVIDTMRSLYNKTYFRLKHGGKVSPPILSTLGVNQGGIASGFMFRRYMADLSDYLKHEFGVCTDELIIVHLLWADDLILLSDSVEGLQTQLNGLLEFCANNHMLVNYVKTKCMAFGNSGKFQLTFNSKPIERVNKYKYLGNIFNETKTIRGDVLSSTYDFLADKGRKAMFSMIKSTRSIGELSIKTLLFLFERVVAPILTYGSDIWGMKHNSIQVIDRVYQHFMKYLLGVKATTSNVIVYGECGRIPLSNILVRNVMCYFNRLANMQENSVVKKVFNESMGLHRQGFKTWVSEVCELAERYSVDLFIKDVSLFKIHCKNAVRRYFENNWHSTLNDVVNNPKLCIYNKIKTHITCEPYLELVKNKNHRNAITKIRTSSHTLEIERGRYAKPKVPREKRVCTLCGVLEDEIHFVTACNRYEPGRQLLIGKVIEIVPQFEFLDNVEKFIYLFTNEDPRILSWLGKFLFDSFTLRNSEVNGPII